MTATEFAALHNMGLPEDLSMVGRRCLGSLKSAFAPKRTMGTGGRRVPAGPAGFNPALLASRRLRSARTKRYFGKLQKEERQCPWERMTTGFLAKRSTGAS